MNTPEAESIRTLVYRMMSNEIQTSTSDLVVTCRVAWSHADGMYCEPLVYNWRGRDHVVKRPLFGMDAFVAEVVNEEATDEYLNQILIEDPSFAAARQFEYDEIDTDRAEFQGMVL